MTTSLPSLRLFTLVSGLLVGLPSVVVEASWITTNETMLDAIFSQPSFGLSPIDIRFEPAVTVVDSDLVTIDSAFDYSLMFALAPNPGTHINMFFVDAINWCGSPGTNIVGCGAPSGSVLAVDSLVASGSFGAELNAHEMGHNLGLGHTSGAGLMGAKLNGDTALSIAETSIILASPLVQSDVLGRFIRVTPVLVRATAVPEPTCTMFICFAAGAVGFCRRR